MPYPLPPNSNISRLTDLPTPHLILTPAGMVAQGADLIVCSVENASSLNVILSIYDATGGEVASTTASDVPL